MKQDGKLRAILRQGDWVIVALCFEWNRAQVGAALLPLRGIHYINQNHCRLCWWQYFWLRLLPDGGSGRLALLLTLTDGK